MLPDNLSKRIVYQATNIKKCERLFNAILYLFNQIEYCNFMTVKSYDMIMVLEKLSEIINNPACLQSFIQSNTTFRKAYRRYQTGLPGLRRLAFELYKVYGPLPDPVLEEYPDDVVEIPFFNPLNFGKSLSVKVKSVHKTQASNLLKLKFVLNDIKDLKCIHS